MFTLDYVEDKFQLVVESDGMDEEDLDVFRDYTSFLRRINLYYSGDGYYIIPDKRVDELIMWFNYYDYNHLIFTDAKIKIKKLREENFKSEAIFSRSKTFNKDIFTDEVIQFNYLIEGCNWGIKRNRAYIADDAGLGKTLESISLFSQLFLEKKIDCVLCVVRKGTSYNWKKEILRFSNQFKEEDIHIILNENKLKPFEINKDKKIIIVSNHLLATVFASYRKDYDKIKRKLSNLRWGKSYVDIFKKWGKNSLALIVDEAHEFKNSKAVKTKSLFAHKEFYNYIYLLSATPAIIKFEDYWVPFNLLDPSVIPYSENAFKLYIAKKIGNKYSQFAISEYNTRHIQDIKNRIVPYIIQRNKKTLPEMKTRQIEQPVYLSMTLKHQKLYDTFTEYAIKQLKEEYDFVNLKLVFEKFFAYLLQIIDNPLLLEGKIEDDKFNKLLNKWSIKDDSKFEYLESELKTIIEDYDEKVIVFDHHPKTLDLLHEKFKKYNPIIVHGKTKDTEKTKQDKQNLFNDKNSKNKVFFLSTLIGGASWNLNNACRREVFYNIPFDATLTRQALDRTWRINSTLDSIITFLLVDHSIDLVRFQKNIKRIEINDTFLNKNLSENELNRLFSGDLFTNN